MWKSIGSFSLMVGLCCLLAVSLVVPAVNAIDKNDFTKKEKKKLFDCFKATVQVTESSKGLNTAINNLLKTDKDVDAGEIRFNKDELQKYMKKQQKVCKGITKMIKKVEKRAKKKK